jgi:hypothetical protein
MARGHRYLVSLVLNLWTLIILFYRPLASLMPLLRHITIEFELRQLLTLISLSSKYKQSTAIQRSKSGLQNKLLLHENKAVAAVDLRLLSQNDNVSSNGF